MADSSPDHRTPRSSSDGESSGSRASVPPSEPRTSSRASIGNADLATERPLRLQMTVALLLGLVLVAIPLYLWRRPRAEPIVSTGTADAGVTESFAAREVTPSPEGLKPTLGERRVTSCQDPGPKKTPPEQCDRLEAFQTAFAKAIIDTAPCMPDDTEPQVVTFVADISFKRKSLHISASKEGRSHKGAKGVTTCPAAIKSHLHAFALDGLAHEHARYKISIVATYPASPK